MVLPLANSTGVFLIIALVIGDCITNGVDVPLLFLTNSVKI